MLAISDTGMYVFLGKHAAQYDLVYHEVLVCHTDPYCHIPALAATVKARPPSGGLAAVMVIVDQ